MIPDNPTDNSSQFFKYLERIFNYSPDLIGIGNLDGYFTEINPACERILGYSREEFLSRPFLHFVHEDDYAPTAEALAQANSGTKEISIENRYRCKDGSFCWIDWRVFSLTEENQFVAIGRDISSLKSAQTKIDDLSFLNKQIIENAQDGIVVYGSDLRYQIWNPAMEKLSGKKAAEAIGRHPLELFPFLKESGVVERIKMVLEGKVVPTIDFPYEIPELDKRGWTSDTSSPLRDSNGQIVGVIGIVRDITERKNAEKELERRTAFLDTIIESSALSLWIADEKGTAIKANPSCLKFFGAEEEEVIGRYNVFQDEVLTAKGFMPTIKKVFEQGEVATIVVDYDFGDVHHVDVKNATHKIIQSVITPVLSGAGKVVNVIFQAIDLTEIKETEAALRRSEERFRLAFQTSPDAINISRMDGTYVEINQGFSQLTGYTKKDVIGKSSIDINMWVNPEEREKLVAGLGKDGFVKNLESRFRMKDGSFKIGLVSASLIDLEGEAHILSVTKDITRLREAEKAHQELETHIRQTQKLESVGVLAGGIAHDFNNILSAILGNINLALFDKNLGEQTKRLLSEAERASLRARDLTQQLLTFAKGGDPVREIASLEEVIKDSAGFVLHGSKVRCNYSIPADLWFAEVDKGQISQVIQNIVINAVHAMPEGGIIQVGCENVATTESKSAPHWLSGNYVKISISDSGTGIPKKHIESIFDPYFSTKQTGSGLGLAICRSIINKHTGDILVDSSPGMGTTFSIYLPASGKTELPEQRKNDDLKISSPAKILIMDDEEMVRNVSMAMLTMLGNEVVLAKDGAEAIKLYREAMATSRPVQLVIMDLTIPGGMGGKDAVQELLKIDADAKVVVASGYSNDPVMANFKNYGFCAAIVKPFQFQDLTMVLSKTLEC